MKAFALVWPVARFRLKAADKRVQRVGGMRPDELLRRYTGIGEFLAARSVPRREVSLRIKARAGQCGTLPCQDIPIGLLDRGDSRVRAQSRRGGFRLRDARPRRLDQALRVQQRGDTLPCGGDRFPEKPLCLILAGKHEEAAHTFQLHLERNIDRAARAVHFSHAAISAVAPVGQARQLMAADVLPVAGLDGPDWADALSRLPRLPLFHRMPHDIMEHV